MIGFIVLKILQNDKWKRTEKILVKVKDTKFESFDNIRFQITNFSYFKAFIGTQQNGRLFINDSQLIILNRKKPYLLNITSTLPLVLNKSAEYQYHFKVCTWRAILLTIKQSGVGFQKTEILLEPNSDSDFERLKTNIKYLC
jgi:hypothetical protein